MSHTDEQRQEEAHRSAMALRRTARLAIEIIVVVFIIIPIFGGFAWGFYTGAMGR